jgi:hypothetical protein
LLGYLGYLLFIFLPGIGLGELLGIWRVEDTLAERFALAFGLGLSVATMVFMVKTSGIAGLRGIGITSVYFTILLGLVALVVSLAIKRKFVFPIRPKAIDYGLLAIILVQSVLLLLYFQKFPFFPQYQSQDFANHVNYVLGLISGSVVTIPTGLIYFGVHYQLAAGVLLVGGEPLFVIERTMAILIVLSPLMFFLGAKRLFGSNRVGIITALIYTLSGTIWYSGPLAAGLYPNFFGILSALFLIVGLVYIVNQTKSVPAWIFFAISVVNAYMSHYTILTVLPAVILLPVVLVVLKRNDWRRYFAPMLVVVLPALIPVLFFPKLIQYILHLASSGGGLVLESTALSSMLASLPAFEYLAAQIYDDAATLALFVLIALYVLFSYRSRKVLTLLPLVWFAALIAAAPFNASAWRYSYEALVPLLIMASFAIHSLLPQTERKAQGMSGRIKNSKQRSPLVGIVLALVFLGLIILGAVGTQVLVASQTTSGAVPTQQNNDYLALQWMKQNTPSNASFVSVSDWWFSFSNVMIGKPTFYSYTATPNESISLARTVNANYIIVTYLVTQSLPSNSALFPWNNFPTSSSGNLTLKYSNPAVRIYEIDS